MNDPKLIRPDIRSTPGWRRLLGKRGQAMPDDLLKEASERLGITALIVAMLWLLGTILDHVALHVQAPGSNRWLTWEVDDTFSAVGLATALALYIFTRRSRGNPRFALDLGLVFLLVTCFIIAMLVHWEPVPADWPVSPIISWLGVAVVIFAALLPSTPVKTLVVGIVAVSMNPLAMLIAKWRGTWEFGSWVNVLLMHYADYLLVGVAVVISMVVRRLGHQVAQAREMGSYQIGELIGSGGMGQVYRATHRMLARPAAIKLIRPEMVGEGSGEAAQLALKRFRREAEAAASLRSPHTVELYDLGVTEDETMYFVMELLEGMTLEALVAREGPLPAGRTVHIIRQVCESLAEAHAAGLIHRDIKPANIHVGRLGLTNDFVKVLDFGLVKSVVDKAGDAVPAVAGPSVATAGGLTPGTPAFMAPEMAVGEPVDSRADIYALGCVAYYLLTAKLVFEAENAVQVLLKHVTESPVPPSVRGGLPMPPELDEVVLACLAKEPADRPQTAIELSRRLGEIRGITWGPDQAAEWWRAAASI
jgi:serine/threonine-protein kinase